MSKAVQISSSGEMVDIYGFPTVSNSVNAKLTKPTENTYHKVYRINRVNFHPV